MGVPLLRCCTSGRNTKPKPKAAQGKLLRGWNSFGGKCLFAPRAGGIPATGSETPREPPAAPVRSGKLLKITQETTRRPVLGPREIDDFTLQIDRLKRRIDGTKLQVVDMELRIHDLKHEMDDSKLRIVNFKREIVETKLQIDGMKRGLGRTGMLHRRV
jgi:hypothetical protein